MKGDSRLDALARDLAEGRISRRTALRRFLGGAAGLAVPTALLTEPALARCPPSRKCGSKCCPKGFRCKNGKCKCKSGLKKCGKRCVDLGSDPANCGSCGHACATGQTCVNGQCAGGATQAVCGDGKAEGTEICDGADLKGANCQTLGFLGGTLSCTANCTYNTSGCTSPSCTSAADCPQGPPGDCQRATCVSGTCGFVADDTDLPGDSNPCTNDICTNGVPSHAFAAAGTACPAGVCNGQGNCVGCNTAADCPQGPAGNCQKAVCTNGACGFVADDTDLPADGNPCTNDICTNGVASHTNVSTGTSCGPGGMVCDGNGSCVGCNAPGDCPGTDDECKTRICANGTCGFNFAPSGTVTSQQTAGDCKRNVCDGSGNIIAANDNADVPPDDGNPCTTETCVNGTVVHSPVAPGTTCPSGVCDGNGNCVQCVNANNCPGPSTNCQVRVCNAGVCGFAPANNGFLCNDGNECTIQDVCSNGVCMGVAVECPPSGDECLDDGICDPQTGTCGYPNKPDGTPCTDGTCQNGFCQQP